MNNNILSRFISRPILFHKIQIPFQMSSISLDVVHHVYVCRHFIFTNRLNYMTDGDISVLKQILLLKMQEKSFQPAERNQNRLNVQYFLRLNAGLL